MNDFIKQLSREDVLANLYIRTNKKFPHKHELEASDVVMIDFYQYTGLFYYYKNAIRMRNTFPVIARGTTTPVPELEGERLGAFIRSVPEGSVDTEVFGPDSVLILFNNSAEPATVKLSGSTNVWGYNKLAYQLNTSAQESSLEGSTLTISPYGIVIMKK